MATVRYPGAGKRDRKWIALLISRTASPASPSPARVVFERWITPVDAELDLLRGGVAELDLRQQLTTRQTTV